ncbi:hydroxyquinol 1,2-dioxygenase [Verminephrobacter eiseniae]|uniref:hydroxyquinol 1,2-dioxygenase n=1 Tax=Verminephrobacter eiseniae TaxID=364317 RepID=UPI002238959D|nr:hydroxyquinol 1,2-dioxygenase [Verminephrobacter eiseniae]MCW5262003.1 hydroxyquinol 1,2-dioxygenase [Verminephrobacter eiseniae]
MTRAISETTSTRTESELGYASYRLGEYQFSRDRNFVRIDWGKAAHLIPVDQFMAALARDIGWKFLYGWIFFDDVFGTVNHYGQVEVFAGKHNPAYIQASVAHAETFPTEEILAVFRAMTQDWISEGYDPLAVPTQTGSAVGPKGKPASVSLTRGFTTPARRLLGMSGDAQPRSDAAGQPINPSFADLTFDKPEVTVEPGFEGQLHAVNVFDHIARSEVTWIPSTVSATRDSLFCMSSEEHMLPVTHGNDRPEWFIQLTDEIHWTIQDKDTGSARGRVIMRAGDVCAMPADIRHKGYAPRRAMLLVLENACAELPELYARGALPPYPVEF